MIIHPIKPVYDKDSRVLILGSFPSVKSREEGFFYGHPQNRFWKVTSRVFDEDLPLTVDEKKAFLLKNHIALWDVIGSCEIEGSSDSSIRNVTVNDISKILKTADITKACIVIGVADHLEIWPEEKWDAYDEEAESAFETVAEDLTEYLQ